MLAMPATPAASPAIVSNELVNVTYDANFVLLKELINAGHNPLGKVSSFQMFQGSTLLHVAAWNPWNMNNEQSIACLQELLNRGLGINDKGHYGRTPLSCAIIGGGHTEIVRFLLEQEADVTIADDFGYTALHYAAQMDKPYRVKKPVIPYQEIITLLLEHGASKTARTNAIEMRAETVDLMKQIGMSPSKGNETAADIAKRLDLASDIIALLEPVI